MFEAESRARKAKKDVASTSADARPGEALPDDDKKSKKQLLDENLALRQRVDDLEAFEIERRAIATELKGTRQRLQYLLAVSPAIIYTTKATGDYACTFVSENLRAIMGYTPQEMTTDPKGWPDHLHPDDAPRAFGDMQPLIGRGGGSVEYRFRHRDGHYIWIQDTFKVVYDDAGRPLESGRRLGRHHHAQRGGAGRSGRQCRDLGNQALPCAAHREFARRYHCDRQAGQHRPLQ